MVKNLEKSKRSIGEAEKGWNEYFKGKNLPKNDKEMRKQMEGFMLWYNNERKQSDTGKTPAEMHRELYGDERIEKSRKIEFEWEEDYKEPNEMLSEADYLINEGKYHNALRILNDLQEIIGDEEELLLMKAEALNCLNKFDEAERCLRKIDKDENYKAYASFYRSQRYVFEGNMFRGLKYMREAYEMESDNFDFIIGIANHFYLMGDKYYTEYVEKARKIDNKRTEKFLKKFWLEPKEIVKEPLILSILNCSNKLMMDEKFDEAYENLNFLRIHENIIPKELKKIVRGLQIECLFSTKKYEKIIYEIDELLKIDKNNPYVYLYKSQLDYDANRFDDALNEIDKCIKIAEKKIPHPDFYMLKAMILKELDSEDYIYYENKANSLYKAQGQLRKMIDEFKEDL